MERGRTFLYHQDCPEGQIFTGNQEIDQKLREGWQEAPYPELLNGQEESPAEPMKPWQKAVAARKSRRQAEGDK